MKSNSIERRPDTARSLGLFVLASTAFLGCSCVGPLRPHVGKPVFTLLAPTVVSNRFDTLKMKVKVSVAGDAPTAIIAGKMSGVVVWAEDDVNVNCSGFVRVIGVDSNQVISVLPGREIELDIEAYDIGGAGDWPDNRREDWALGEAGWHLLALRYKTPKEPVKDGVFWSCYGLDNTLYSQDVRIWIASGEASRASAKRSSSANVD